MPKLRYILLVDGEKIPRWQSRVIDELRDSGHADLVQVYIKEAKPNAKPRSFFDKIARNSYLLWNLYNRRISNRVKALQQIDLSKCTDAPSEVVSPVKVGRFGEAFPSDTLAQIRKLRPDFILRLGFGILKGEILECARYGVWSFHHGDPEWVRGVPPGFWEVFHKRDRTGVMLQRLNEKLDKGQVLHRGFFKTAVHSYPRTLNLILSASAYFPARVCAELVDGGDLPEVEIEKFAAVKYRPKNLEVITHMGATFFEKLRVFVRHRVSRQQWSVAHISADAATVAGLRGREAQLTALRSAVWLPSRKNEFFADPFPVPSASQDGTLQILMERYDWDAEIGTIARTSFSSGSFGNVETVYTQPTHLSYPSVFRDEDVEYIVPENSAGKSVVAFTQFMEHGNASPSLTVLGDCPLVDPTFVRHDGRVWLFGTIDQDCDDCVCENTKLYAFHAKTMSGPWTPHTLNPIKCDIASARPAGSFLVKEGELYRVAQDCAEDYGKRIIVHRITELSPTRFGEIKVSECNTLSEWPDFKGVHTLAGHGESTLIDAYTINVRAPF